MSSKSGSQSTGVLIGLLIGLVVGAMIALPIANSQRYRHAYPRGLMNVMEHELDGLQDSAASDDCPLGDTQVRTSRLAALSRDTAAAFHAEDDARFVELQKDLNQTLQDAAASPSCAGLREQLEAAERACEACHQGYR
ncbi:MAG: cytochrome c [Xanthomonadales bacterium]|nr:cytochrome c [Xanthomonadales bacterium]